jgi:hypothetical protein
MSRQIPWKVFLNNRLIDTVYYDRDCDAEYVRRSLIEHDGFNANIKVRK